jgi:hypothetical protein
MPAQPRTSAYPKFHVSTVPAAAVDPNVSRTRLGTVWCFSSLSHAVLPRRSMHRRRWHLFWTDRGVYKCKYLPFAAEIHVADIQATRLTRKQGYCRMGSCSNPPARAVGAACKRTEECVGEGYSELNPSCSEETGTCGGFGSFSYADNGAGTGPSSICASGM